MNSSARFECPVWAQSRHSPLHAADGDCPVFPYRIDGGDPAEGDRGLEGDSRKVIEDEVSLPFLSNAVIDFSDELIGARFVIENPNATSSCGCGTSFSI